MSLILDRLTFVYQEDPGPLGTMLEAERRVVRFGAEGSGIIELESLVAGDASPQETRIPVRMVEVSALNGPLAELLANEPLPCLVGHAAASAVVLLGADSVARCSANPADLRGKVRFALARVGWKLR